MLTCLPTPIDQAWLAHHGLWALVAHAFAPQSEDSGRLASAILANLASNAANKPLMYKAELRLKSASWRESAKTAGGVGGKLARGGMPHRARTTD